MTALTPWNPFQQMEELQDRLSSFADFAEWSPVRNGRQTPPDQEWAPLVDVIETAEEYLIRADLPGVQKSELGVTLEDGQLTLQGRRHAEPLPEGAGYTLNERPYGTFTRTFVLPSWADASNIEAEFKHGVLTIKVRKAEQARARRIAIQGE